MKRLRGLAARALLALYKRRKRRLNDLSLTHCLDAARQTIAATPYCFLVSAGQSSSPSARFVEPIVDFGTGRFLIGTDPSLRKVAELATNPHVTLAFGNTKQRANVVVYGTGKLITDQQQKQRFWKTSWRLFFPNGPRSDNYVVIEVQAQRLELMSFRHNVVAEPFGLRPVVLEFGKHGWAVASNHNNE